MFNRQSIIKLWRKFCKEYNQLCKELGVEQGGCRSCVPKYQFDENGKRIEQRLPEYHRESSQS